MSSENGRILQESNYFKGNATYFKSLQSGLKPYNSRPPYKTQETGQKTLRTQRKKLHDSFMKKIMDELFEVESSRIQEEKEKNQDVKDPEEVAHQFVERQAFLDRESKILKKMMEFCQYGVIRPGFH